MAAKKDTKSKIISAAISVFAEKGKHGARMEEIAAQASVNKAMVYYYYTSKEILFKEVLKILLVRISENIIQSMQQVIESTDDQLKIIEAFIHAHNRAFTENVDYTKVLLNAIVNTPEDFREILEAIRPNLKYPRKLMESFEKGISQNKFREVDPMQVFISIIGTNLIYFFGKPIAEVIMNLEITNEQAFLQKRENSVVDLLLYGLVRK